MRFLFHGASVTQQKYNGSYVNCFTEMIGKSHTVVSKGFGGCHFNDAGYLTIDELTDDQIDVCFLEWNTTGVGFFEPHKLKYVVEVLLSKRILPVILILAGRDNLLGDRNAEVSVISLCESLSLPLLDYRKLVDPKLHLRDHTHTNDEGAKLYSNELLKDLPLIVDKFETFSNNWDPSEHPRPKLRILPADCEAIMLEENESLSFFLQDIGDFAEIILEVDVGPSSGYVLINNDRKINFWDQWCHFSRPSFKTVYKLSNSEPHILTLFLCDDIVDYSSCTKDFSYEGNKKLNIRKVWGVNCKPVLV
ncbi:TPA: hypothetical protein NKQ48_000728 [Vibrio parahaemolyticus]|nr:hypothetical protein [Vibrio parahaemolyticus]MBE4362140.1 hypothetical protein [Vibrio parahaemolyticus]MBE5185250.1 hypothetical protein [Vibrio parahaemolyticus]MBE5198760.1 hypothetical protein [Vibrio parahaemolyticus]HCG8166702.1 hypothetical protein [Vibrio parahaemolyticus]